MERNMKKINLALISASAMLLFVGCGGEGSAGDKITYSKSAKEVYETSCKKCHGDNGEGNVKKKAPALNDRQAGELELDLYDVKNGGLNQSSATEYDVMEHNMQKLIAKGYDYDPKAMAQFLEKSFYKKSTPVTEAPEAPAEVAPETPAGTNASN